jgi:hypothetical protein
MFASIFILSLSGMGAYDLIVWLEKKAIRWKGWSYRKILLARQTDGMRP